MRRRGIYLLPNLFTTAALFAGFYAIVQAMNVTLRLCRDRDFRRDGARRPRRPRCAADTHAKRVRRRVRQPRRHGVFGAAPALVMYEWVAARSRQAGLDCGLRVRRRRSAAARALQHAARRRGQALVHRALPSPSAAALVAGLVWIVDDLRLRSRATSAGGPGSSRSSPDSRW